MIQSLLVMEYVYHNRKERKQKTEINGLDNTDLTYVVSNKGNDKK